MTTFTRKTLFAGATALTLAAGLATLPTMADARGFGGGGGGGHFGGGGAHFGGGAVGGGHFAEGGGRFGGPGYGGRVYGGRGYGVGLGLGALAATGAYAGTCGYSYGYYRPYACGPYGYNYD